MTQQGIKAIETVYNGYRFRSRLEARWAVFFDTLGVKYEYEKEGFDLGKAGWYLPDFWLPDLNCWAEVKGQDPSDDELAKARYLVASSPGEHGLVFLQQIIDTTHLVRRKHLVTVLTAEQLDATSQQLTAFIVYNFLVDGEPFNKDATDFVAWRRCPICNNVALMGTESHNWSWISCGCIRKLLEDTYEFVVKRELPLTRLSQFLASYGLDGLIIDPDIADAFDAARQARFEHGETPTIHKL